MNRLSVRLVVALLTFVAGVLCARAVVDSFAPGLGRAAAAVVGSALCFALAYAGEKARRHKSDAAIAFILPLLCVGFALLALSVWELVQVFFVV